MQIGRRIIFNKLTGKILDGAIGERNDVGLTQEMANEMRPLEIDFIDLVYGDTQLKDADQYHIDVVTKKIVIDKKIEHTETTEEKLKRLENEVLLNNNKNIEGGIF